MSASLPSPSEHAGDLGRRAARGASLVVAGQGARFCFQIAGMVFLARLVSPEDYGLVAMVMAVIGVGEVIRDMGLSQATMQARTLSQQQKSNLFWVNVSLGLGLCVVTSLLAVPISIMYARTELIAIVLILAWTFVVNGVATQFRAQMNREVRYGWIVGGDISSVVVSYSVALIAAYYDWGFYAICVQLVVQSLVVMLTSIVGCRWLPGLPRRGSNTLALVRFGSTLAVSQIITFVSRNVDSIVIGLNFGAQNVGLYDRAYQMMMLPLNQVQAPSSNVAIPVLSRLNDDYGRYRSYLLKGQCSLVYIVCTLLAFSWLASDYVIPSLLGSQWVDSVPILQILILSGAFQAAQYPAYWVFVSRGLIRENLIYTIVNRSVFISLIVCGSFFSVHMVAAGYCVGVFCSWLLAFGWLRKVTLVPIGAMFYCGARVVFLASGGVASAVLVANWLGLAHASLEEFLVRLLVFLVASGAAIVSVPVLRRDMGTLLGVVRLATKRN